MEVILLERVAKLGQMGETVRVKDGFARNFLLPKGKAPSAGDHVAFIWTFTGRHATSGNALDVKGWEEWDLDAEGLIAASKGWFDPEDYARQVAGR